MIKDIVVNLSVGEGGGPAADYAVSLASALEAHIAGIAFVYDPIVPVLSIGYSDTLRRDNEVAAKAAIDHFVQVTSHAGVSAEPLTVTASFADAGDQFGRIARYFDLAVVGQTEPEPRAIEVKIAESALFDSGRPVIFVPYIHKAPLKLDHVMVCWDASRPAARAVADAMPLLDRSGRVEVVTVANEPGKQKGIKGVDMGRHLARHGLNVEVKRITRDGISVADVLLSHVNDADVDFIVMGGYGHSRLREFVLGGVTHSILRTMTVPVLMSH